MHVSFSVKKLPDEILKDFFHDMNRAKTFYVFASNEKTQGKFFHDLEPSSSTTVLTVIIYCENEV